MNPQTIFRRFSCDTEKLIKDCASDLDLPNDKEYQDNIDTVRCLVNFVPAPDSRQKESLKSKILENAATEKSLLQQLKENIAFTFISAKKRSAAVTGLLCLCIILLSPSAMALGEYIRGIYSEQVASYKIGDIKFIKEIQHFEHPSDEDLTEVQNIINHSWHFTTKVDNYFGIANPPGRPLQLHYYSTFDEVQKAIYFEIKAPDYMPSNAALNKMIISPSNKIFYMYDTPAGGIDITQERFPYEHLFVTETPKSVSLNTTKAAWFKKEHALIWKQNDLLLTIKGDISLEEAIKIANSLK